MATISILSWNIEHFNGKGGIDRSNKQARKNRVKNVVKVIKDADVDVFGLSEVEGKDVHEAITKAMPNFTFHITEGRQSQEILIGVKSGITSFFTQRNEFKRSNPYLRPGALLTITKNGAHYPILFTHLKSMPSPEGFGLRDAMFDKVFSLKRALDKVSKSQSGGPSNFIVVGDMNTMGMDYDGKKHDIPQADEIAQVTSNFKRRKMKALPKSHPHTFNNGSDSDLPPSDLDHVFAAAHLTFKGQTAGAEVHVGGWAELTTAAKQDAWITKFSDHAPLTFTLTGV